MRKNEMHLVPPGEILKTVNGKAAAVVQDAEAYQRLLDVTARADAAEGIRQGLEDVAKGRTRPVREFLASFRRDHGVPGWDCRLYP